MTQAPASPARSHAERALRRVLHVAKNAALLGWKVILAFSRDRGMFAAGAVTFFTLLAIFPTLGAFIALWGLFADPAHARDPLSFLSGAVPAEILNYVFHQMGRLAKRGVPALGAQFATSLVLALWSADVGVKALVYAINIAYQTTDKRNYLAYTLLTMTFTVGGLVFILVTSALVMGATWLPIGLSPGLLQLLRWPALFVVYVAMLYPLYRYGPCRPPTSHRKILPGAVIAALSNLVVSSIFAWYLGHVVNLDITYGPLGATVGFLLWTWWSVIVILLGAELNGVLEVRADAADRALTTPAPDAEPAPWNRSARG